MKYPQWIYRLRNAPLHGLTRFIIWLVRILPPQAGFGMGRGLAAMVWSLMPHWRRTASRNLELMFGKKYNPAERLAIGRQSAINLGYHVIEFIHMGFVPEDQALAMVVEVEGKEHYDKALEQGRGVIGLAMHYGNWELSGAYMAQKIGTLYAVGKEQRDEFFTEIAFPWRARFGIKNIMAGDKVNSAIIRALKENCVLGLLADQNGGKNGTFANFAGTPASTVAGPAALALKFNAPLLVTFCRRISPGKLKFIARPPLDTSGLPDDKKDAQIEMLNRINAAYAEVIAEDPTQWLWGHKRWKTRPPGEDWLY